MKVVKRGSYYTHHVTVQNLDAEKEYYFRVGDGYISYAKGKTDGVEYIEREMPAVEVFSQKTLPVITEVQTPNPAYGTSYNLFYSKDGQVGMKKNFDAIIFLKTYKAGMQYPLMSAVSNNDGGWSIDYANVRDSEGKTLDMENTYVEFIPQVENARPGASGTSRFEDTEYPLNLMGNNMDDLKKELEVQEEEKELGSVLKKLTNGVIADEYDDAVFCFPKNGCTGKTFTKIDPKVNGGCPTGWQTSKPASCNTPNPPTGEPPAVQYKNCCSKGTASCYCIRDTKCSSGQVEYSGTAAQAKAACEASIVTEPEKMVTCCVKLTTDCNCISNRQPGTCPAGYSQYDTNNLESARTQCKADSPKTCCTYNATKNTCSCGKTCTAANLTQDACNEKVEDSKLKTCCTYNATKNTCSCGKACTAANLTQDACNEKVVDSRLKTCCKQTVGSGNKVSCNCLENQITCSGGYKEFSSANSCKAGTVAQGECGSDGVGSNFILDLNPSEYITVPRPATFTSLFDRFISRSYADDSGGETLLPVIYKSSTPCNETGATVEDDDGCSESTIQDKRGCKACYSEDNCMYIFKKGSDCPVNYTEESTKCGKNLISKFKTCLESCKERDSDKECKSWNTYNDCKGILGFDGNITDSTRNSSAVANQCHKVAYVETEIVAGGCDGTCYIQYKNPDGSRCGNIQLPPGSALCPNVYCGEQRVKLDTCNETCEGNLCLCPVGCNEAVAKDTENCGGEKAEDLSTEEIANDVEGYIQNLYQDAGSPCNDKEEGSQEEACIQNWIIEEFFEGNPQEEDDIQSEENDIQGEDKLLTCWKKKSSAQDCEEMSEKQVTCNPEEGSFYTKPSCEEIVALGDNGYLLCYSTNMTYCTVAPGISEEACKRESYYHYKDPTCGGTKNCYKFDSIDSPCVQRSCLGLNISSYQTILDCEVDRHKEILKRDLHVSTALSDDGASSGNVVCCPYYAKHSPYYPEVIEERPALLDRAYCIGLMEKKGDLSRTDLPGEEECSSSGTSGSSFSPLAFKSHAQNNEEGNNTIFYLPEGGVYSVKTSLNSQPLKVVGGTKGGYLLYKDRDGIEGYQSPEDPQNPQENEDIILNLSGLEMEISKETSSTELTLKRGINIISFNSLPSLGESQPMTSHDFLKIANRFGSNVSRISYFSGGQWNGGTSYDFDKEEVKGVSFDLIFGKGYLVVAESDVTIAIPSYSISKAIPIAFSSGWNLVGVHGYDTQYTAKTLLNSINTIQGLKANNVAYWLTSKGMYQGYQLSEGQEYGQDFPISKDLGYFVRINEYTKPECKSIWWNPGSTDNEKCSN